MFANNHYYRVFPIKDTRGYYGPDFQEHSFVAVSMLHRWPGDADLKDWEDDIKREILARPDGGSFQLGSGRQATIWFTVVRKHPWPAEPQFAAAAWAAISVEIDKGWVHSYTVPVGGNVGARAE